MLKNMGGKIKNKYFILGLLIILNLSIKIFILFNSDQLMDSTLDKCLLVNFARDMLLGEERLSILYYFDPHDIVAGLFTGTLLTISFMVFGISGFALKIIPILTSTAIVVLAYLFLNKFFNKKTAIIVSLLFIFAPFAYTMRTFMLWEDYKISILLVFLIMYIFFNIFYNNRKSYWNFILLGLISGFALSFFLWNFIIILIFMLLWFSFDKKFFVKKNFLIFLAAFLVMLLPLIIHNYTHDFSSFDIIKLYLKTDNNLVTYKNDLPIYSNLISLITKDIPYSFNFKDIGFVGGVFLNYAYYFIFIISFGFLFYKNRISFLNFIKNVFLLKNKKRISKEIFIIVYPIFYIIVYLFLGMTPFSQFYYTHLLPLYPFIFISIGLFVVHLYQKRNWKLVSIFLIMFVLFLGLKLNLDLLSPSTEEKVDYLGVCDNSGIKHHRFIGHYLRNVTLAKKECQKLDKEEWRWCYDDIGEYIARSFLVNKNIPKSINDCLLLDEQSGGCIEILTKYAGGDKNAPEICDFFPEDYKRSCYFNFGVSIALNKDVEHYSEKCKVVKDKYFDSCKKGYLAQKSIKEGYLAEKNYK